MKKAGRVFRKLFYGIQGRFLKYVLLLLAVVLLFSGLGMGLMMRGSIRQASLDRYAYANERISLMLKDQYEISDALMRRCIANQEFQNSLLSRELTVAEQQSLNQFLSYMNMDYLQNYLYVDNKGNVFGKPYQTLPYDNFVESGFSELLGTEYSVTKWFMEEDRLFRGDDTALFVGRYIRNMDFSHKPGILILKMDSGFFDFLLSEAAEDGGIYLLLDQAGRPFYVKTGEEGRERVSEAWMRAVASFVEGEGGTVRCGAEGLTGTAIYTRQRDTGFYVVTFLPDSILNEAIVHTLLIMALVYVAAALCAGVFSVWFSSRFTGPIRQINDAMQAYHAGEEGSSLRLHTGTELDTIGNSYNRMTEDIRQLLIKVREQERELYDREMNSLMEQINPHFLYNTLDTIYMLARINREETTMRMIQALSKFLKVSLSKGDGMISVADELEHVKSYMDIQKIRNRDLFTYEVSIFEKRLLDRRVMKLILQPLVENSIKHGFCDIFENGRITIDVGEEGDLLVFKVRNNGLPMREEDVEQIQRMYECDYREIENFFRDREGGYGVRNVMGRLRLKYGTKMQYYYEREEDGTLCVIKIPEVES